jgi:hypothetical protein
MKKVIISTVSLLGISSILVFTSCYKEQDWNCVCKDSNGNETTDLIKDKTRKEATAECNSKINILGYERECKLNLF